MAELEVEGAGLRHVTEELAVFDQLPDEITLLDANECSKIYEQLSIAESLGNEEEISALRRQIRALLEDLAFHYKVDRNRTAERRTIAVRDITDGMRKVHPGEDPN